MAEYALRRHREADRRIDVPGDLVSCPTPVRDELPTVEDLQEVVGKLGRKKPRSETDRREDS